MNISVKPLYLGTFSVGLDKRFNRISRDQEAEKGALKLSMNPFLVRFDDKIALIDAGLGELDHESHIPALLEAIEAESLSPDDITDVFVSHQHFDHIGGLANRQSGFWDLTFPNAKIWLSEQEWNKLKGMEQKNPLKEQFIAYLDVHADLNYVNDGDTPYPGVTARVIGGHTEFHLAWMFNFDNARFFNAGDVLGTKGAVNRRYVAKYDFDGKRSQAMRDELVGMAWEEKYHILAYHDTDIPLFRIKEKNDKNAYILEGINEIVS